MKKLGLNEIREKYLAFFKDKGHLIMKSFPLTPINDNSLLMVSSGMAPLKPYFAGQEVPPSKRVATCQKCVRTTDIENVGYTMRHGTFFEMLGNFSFGDYFKEEVIPWAWEFCTKVLELPAELLYPSVYEDDDEAFAIWRDKMGMPVEKISRMGKDDNFWEIGLGPCGPCSEIYFDRGEKYGCGSPDCKVGCECDRFIEIWNLVFTQFCKNEDGTYSKLKNTNIDTGMGLDRVAMVMQDVLSIFDVDTMVAVRNAVVAKVGVEYGIEAKKDISLRIITDHVRAVTFIVADGILPSNESRGYVLRRLLRRAVRHLKLLGVSEPCLAGFASVVVEQYGGAYPELQEKKDFIRKLITVEEQRFYETLDEGTEQIKKLMDEARSMKIIAGVDAFRMYDTYGFPVELLCEIVEEQGLAVDMDGFGAEMEKQRKRGREGRETSTFMGRKETVFDTLGTYGPTLFLGYDEKSVNDAKVLHVFKSDDTECVIADKTVIYAESGGQKGDGGVIETETGVFRVTDCTENSGKYVHFGVTEKGTITAGQTGCISYDAAKRAAAMRNHTATHILQKVLRQILGSHVEQAGSMVSGERLRFDFTHFEAVTAEQRHLIEEKVNDAVFDALDVNVSEMPVDEAKRLGAIALFGEKYGAYVRVVDIGGGYSVELCGGTHITNTAQIGSFKLVSESGISAGVRRIEGLTGRNVISYYKDMENRNEETVAELKRVIRKLTKDVEAANAGNAAKEAAGLADKMRTLNGVNILVSEIADADVAALREMGDELKSRFNPGVFVLAGTKEQKAAIIAMATDDAVKLGINCGAIIKAAAAAAGGSGGGKPNMAQAGVKDSSLIDDALKEADEMIKKALQQ